MTPAKLVDRLLEADADRVWDLYGEQHTWSSPSAVAFMWLKPRLHDYADEVIKGKLVRQELKALVADGINYNPDLYFVWGSSKTHSDIANSIGYALKGSPMKLENFEPHGRIWEEGVLAFWAPNSEELRPFVQQLKEIFEPTMGSLDHFKIQFEDDDRHVMRTVREWLGGAKRQGSRQNIEQAKKNRELHLIGARNAGVDSSAAGSEVAANAAGEQPVAAWRYARSQESVVDELLEMAVPTEPIKTRTYYHGSSKQANGEKILQDGQLIAPQIEDLDTRYGKAHQRPVEGRVYLTPSLRYAVIYALGASMAGHAMPESFIKRDGRYGYLFSVAGADIADVEPDEDTLGGLASQLAYFEPSEYDDHPELRAALREDPALVQRLARELKMILPAYTYQKASAGEAAWQSKAGKKLLKHLDPQLRLKLVELGVAVAGPQRVRWTSAWRIDKLRSQELKRDGSNFFEIAEQIA